MPVKNYASLISFFIFIVFLADTASAIGISPAILQIDNAQGLQASYRYYVRAGTRTNIDVTIDCDLIPELEEYITMDIDERPFSVGELRYFNVFVNIPSNFTIPGNHLCLVQAGEVPDEGDSGMTAYSGISSQVYLRIPYPKKYIEASMEVPNVNKSMPVPFKINLISRGLQNVTASGVISVTDSEENTLATIYTKQVMIESLGSGVLETEWDSSGSSSGVYKANARIEYGGDKPAITEKTFRIGEILIEITNVTYPELITPDKIHKLDVSVQSFWNMLIEDVYIDMEVYKDGSMMGSTSPSETFDIAAWEEKTVNVYWDTNGLEEGTYDAKFTVHYSGRESEKSITVEVNQPQDFILLIIIIAVIIAVLVALYFLRKRKKRTGEVNL